MLFLFPPFTSDHTPLRPPSVSAGGCALQISIVEINAEDKSPIPLVPDIKVVKSL